MGNSTRDQLRNRPNHMLGAFDIMQQATGDANSVESIGLVSIFEITPDPAQPRRVVPNTVRSRAEWNGGPETTKGLFDAWIDAFAEESDMDSRTARMIVGRLLEGKPLDEDDMYQDGSEAERHMGPVTASLLAVVDLAASIRRDGLINPATLYQTDPAAPPGQSGYRIETGERRWLAFHLLYTFTGDTKWNKMPAQIVGAPSVWKQAVENNARMELTAIGKARQLAILVMDLYAQAGHEFQPYEAFDHDRHFYAQVADGNIAFRIPKGKGEEIMQAMGLKSPKRLGQFRALLRLPDELWSQADDENWSEGFIREQAVRLRGEFDTSTIVEVSDEEEPTSPIGEVLPYEETPEEESLSGFQVGDWISADLGDHVMTGQVTGFDDEYLVVATDKGTARIDPQRVKGITLHAEPPFAPVGEDHSAAQLEQSYIHSEPVSAPPAGPKQHPKPTMGDAYMHRIYEAWRAQFPKDTIVFIEYDGAYLALSLDDSHVRQGSNNPRPGGIGLSGSADYMLVTKIDHPFVRQLQKQRNVMIVRFDDLDDDMQFVAGKASRARSVPLNRLADFQQPDEAAARAKAEREAREAESRALLLEWQETMKQWEAQIKDFKTRAGALRVREAGQAATETQRFSSFLGGFKSWLERKQ